MIKTKTGVHITKGTLDLYLCSRGCEGEIVNDFCHTVMK